MARNLAGVAGYGVGCGQSLDLLGGQFVRDRRPAATLRLLDRSRRRYSRGRGRSLGSRVRSRQPGRAVGADEVVVRLAAAGRGCRAATPRSASIQIQSSEQRSEARLDRVGSAERLAAAAATRLARAALHGCAESSRRRPAHTHVPSISALRQRSLRCIRRARAGPGSGTVLRGTRARRWIQNGRTGRNCRDGADGGADDLFRLSPRADLLRRQRWRDGVAVHVFHLSLPARAGDARDRGSFRAGWYRPRLLPRFAAKSHLVCMWRDGAGNFSCRARDWRSTGNVRSRFGGCVLVGLGRFFPFVSGDHLPGRSLDAGRSGIAHRHRTECQLPDPARDSTRRDSRHPCRRDAPSRASSRGISRHSGSECRRGRQDYSRYSSAGIRFPVLSSIR